MKKTNTNLITSRIRFGILLVLGIAACITFGSMFWSNSKAQDLSTDKKAEKPQQPSDDLDKQYAKLIGIAREQGAVRVIIGLRYDGYKLQGELNETEREKQRVDLKPVQSDFLERLASYNIKEVKQFQFIPFLAAEVDAEVLEKMRQDPQISSIQEDEAVEPTLAQSIPVVGAPSAWSAGYSGSGWAVAILDTGVDKNHSFLSGRVVSEACYSSNNGTTASSVCPGGVTQSTASNSGLNCSLSISGCDHGTHVAGIAAGRGTSSNGVAKDGNVIAIQVFSRFDNQVDCESAPAPCARTYSSDQILGLERVLTLSSSINIAAVNMSLGGGQYFSNCDAQEPSRKAAIDNLRSVGIATVISSGNDSYTNAIGAPACISSAVSVGSTGDGSNGAALDVVRSNSNSASYLNLLAPGASINSSVPGGNFANKSGTSMAAPHVAGAWAVLKQRVPTASVTQILNALTSTGQPITDARNNIVKPRIKVDAALQSLGGGCTYTLNPTSRNLSASSNSSSVNVNTQAGCNWSATIDAPSLSEIFSPLQDKNFISLFDHLRSNEGLENLTVAQQALFLNSTPITIPSVGAGTPYPSTINVSGQSGTITNVTVALNGISHTYADDVGVLLVGPTGIKVRLMTDVGGSGDFNTTDITFDDTASSMPDNPTTNFISGTYKPTQGTNTTASTSNLHSTNFPSPAPVSPYSLTLSSFNGQNPNGTWSLYVDDDSLGDAGMIATGWALGITTSGGGTSWINITSGSSGTGNGTVNYNVNANTGASPRTGTITVNGQVHTVTQAGTGGGCSVSSITVGQTLNGSLTSSDCVVSGTSRRYDVYSFSGQAGQGVAASMDSSAFDTYLYLTDSANQVIDEDNNSGPGTNSRIPNASGFFTLPATGSYFLWASSASDNLTGSYSVSLSGCTYSISSSENEVGPGNGGGSFQMDALSGCGWSAVSDSTSWLTTSSSGSGDGTVRYDFTANTSTSPRTGRITVGGQVSTITQIGLGGAGNVRFSSATYGSNEGAADLTITVTRAGGTAFGSVQYSTSDGTATAGVDYVSASGTLLFGENQTSKSFNVTILDDTAFEGDESFSLSLNNNSSSFTLGSPSSATVTIVDNDTLQAPTANAGGPYAAQTGQSIQFNGSASSDPDGTINSYSWDFGDGSSTGTGVTPTHAYASAGAYTVTLTVTDDDGATGSASTTANITQAGGTAGLQYYPLSRPVRLLDTRPGQVACFTPGAPLAADASRTQTAVGTCQGLVIPASAKAIVGNATVVSPPTSGHITLYPAGAPLPIASNLNYVAGQIVPNAFTVGLSPDGSFNIFTPTSTHFIVDVAGYYALPGAGGLYYHPLPRPVRLLDTRIGQIACDAPGAPLQAGGVRTESARTTCNGVVLPAAAQAIVGNATVVNNSGGASDGHIILYPSGAAQPVVSNLNYVAGQIVPNAFTVGLGADGAFNIFAYTSTHFIVDVTGYYSASAAADSNGAAGLLFYPLPSPARLLDTRPGQVACDAPGAPLAADSVRTEQARLTCAGSTVPTSALAVLGNATVVTPAASGHIILYPSGSAQPLVSNLNYLQGQIVPNAFNVGLGADGAFKIYTPAQTHFVIDMAGYFAP